MNTDISRTVCFTGHRPQSLGGFSEDNPIAWNVKSKLQHYIEKAIKLGFTDFISGGALGVDQWAAQIVLNLKDKHPQIKLIIARPFPSQSSPWIPSAKIYFNELCSKADEVIDVSQDPYTGWKMQIRNEFMVNNSALVIAVWNGTAGGTANAVNYAKSKNKTIIQIKPKEE
jgi:uncharacterized phage-like protein YoqJ